MTVDTSLRDMVPAIYFHSPDGLIPIGVNVWVTTDSAVSETQPPLWDSVKTVYYGGHENPISDAEAAFLIAANPEYADYIFDDSVPAPPDGGGVGSGFGVSGYGSGGYGL